MLYPDIYAYILLLIEPSQYYKYKLVSKLFKEIIEGLSNEGKYRLSITQQRICRRVIASASNTIIQAPLSFGKTVVGLTLANHNTRTIIVASHQVLEHWIREAKQMYGAGICTHRRSSSIYACIPEYRHHIKWLKRVDSAHPRIIVITPLMFQHHRYALLPTYNPSLIVVDDIEHDVFFSRLSKDIETGNVARSFQLVGLTHSDYSDAAFEVIQGGMEEVEDYLPVYQTQFIVFKANSTFPSICDLIITQRPITGYTILFVSKKDLAGMKIVKQTFQRLFPQNKVFFRRHESSYQEFKLCPRKDNPLFVYLYETGCRGLNFNIVDNVYMLSPHSITQTMISWTVDSFSRVNNPNKRINLFGVLSSDPYDYVIGRCNMMKPATTDCFLKAMNKAYIPAIVTSTRLRFADKHELSDLEYYILFHSDKYNIECCGRYGIFSRLPQQELRNLLSSKI